MKEKNKSIKNNTKHGTTKRYEVVKLFKYKQCLYNCQPHVLIAYTAEIKCMPLKSLQRLSVRSTRQGKA